jgi:hypothetical protein
MTNAERATIGGGSVPALPALCFTLGIAGFGTLVTGSFTNLFRYIREITILERVSCAHVTHTMIQKIRSAFWRRPA